MLDDIHYQPLTKVAKHIEAGAQIINEPHGALAIPAPDEIAHDQFAVGV